MGACSINEQINFEDFSKAGVKINDVHQHYLETGKIGSPEAIKYKLEQLEKGKVPENVYEHFQENQEYSFTDKAVSDWLKSLSKGLGIEYNMISYDEAFEIHNAKGKIYNYESAFFHNGQVYFISGTLTPESVVHEFMHPFVKVLMKENPELFNTLYDQLSQTEDGKRIIDEVKNMYSDKSIEPSKEEVFVRALTASTLMTSPKEEFNSWIKNLLVTIKQLLRKVIGKSIEIHKLDPMTSMKDLADIISKGDKVKLDKALYTDKDAFEYMRDYDNFIDGFTKTLNDSEDNRFIQEIIDNTVQSAINQIKNIEENKDEFVGLENLADALIKEFDQGLLTQIRDELGPFASTNDIVVALSKDNAAFLTTSGVLEQRLKSLTNTLFKVKDMLSIMNKEIDDVKSLSSREQIETLHFYSTFIDNWSAVVGTFKGVSTKYKSDETSALNSLSKDLSSLMDTAQQKLLDIKTNAVADILYEMLKPAADKVLDRFNEVARKKSGKIFDVTKVFSSQSGMGYLDDHYLSFHNMTEEQYKKYQTLKTAGAVKNAEYQELHGRWMRGLEMTKDKVVEMLRGTGGDSNFFNSMLESASLNTDGTIHSLQQHIQSQIALYEAMAKTKFEDYLNVVQKHIKKINFQNRGSVGRKLGQVNTIGVIVNGEVVEHKEWGYLQEFIGWEIDKVNLQHSVSKAKEAYNTTNSDVDKKALDDAIQEYADWKNKYMHQKYDAEYYEADKILTRDDVGQEAKRRREEIFEKMSYVQQDVNLTEDEMNKKTDLLWKEYMFLQATHDIDGVRKTGTELEIAERLKEYSQAKSKFINFVEIPGAFQEAYNNYSEKIINAGFPYDTDPDSDYQKMMNHWIEENTTVSLKNSVLDARQKLLDRRAQLLETLVAANKGIADDTEQRQLIADMVKFVSDNVNQPDGTVASKEVREKVKMAHEQIEAMLDNLYSYKGLGLTRSELNRLSELQNKFATGTITPVEDSERQTLLNKQLTSGIALGLDPLVIAELKAIDKQLGSMTSKEPTDAFDNVMRNIFSKPALFDLLQKHLDDNNIQVDELDDVETADFLDFITNGDTKKAFKVSSDLQNFVNANFYEKEVYSIDDSKNIKVLALTDLWLHNASIDPVNMKTKMLKDAKTGANLGLIKINGVFRTPSMAFQQRMVKDEYVTEKIVGKTVDNRGRWLPKAESTNKYKNNAYEAMKMDDPDMFEFLEDMKAEYLKMQEGAEDYDKLYMSFPQTRKTRLENVITANIFRFARRFKEFMYGTGDDIESMGIAKQMTADDLIEEHKMGVFEHQDSGMPVKGVARLRFFDDQSTDILKTMPEYMASLMHKQGARKASSFSRSLLDVVSNENATSRNKDNARMSATRGLFASGLKFWKGGKNRQSTMRAIIERDIDGIFSNTSWSSPRLEKSINAMNKLTGFRLFSANPVSGIKNAAQIKLTAITHSFAFDEMNPIDFAVGEGWATIAAAEISTRIRSRGQKGYYEQIVQLFDPTGGRTTETMGDNLSRTFAGDILDLRFLQNMRKWTELQGTIGNFAGLMNNQKVTITKGGITKKISYLNAFELVDGKLQTKEGIDPKYALTYDTSGNPILGEELIKQKLKMQQVITTWNGTFAKKDAPLIERNLIGKQFTFLRKHLIPMTVKNIGFSVGSKGNFAKKRMNWTTGKAEWGHFVGSVKTLITTLRTLGTNIPYMTKEELASLAYVVNYIVIGHLLLPYLQGLVTFYKSGDDDDEDADEEKINYKKMMRRSGNLEDPTFTVSQNDHYDFEMKGFILNQTALLSAQVKDEYNSLNYTSFTGIRDNARNLNPSPINLATNVNLAIKLLSFASGHEKDEFTTKDSGPYMWHNPNVEHGKLYDALFDVVGVNGKFIAPVKSLEQYEDFKRMN